MQHVCMYVCMYVCTYVHFFSPHNGITIVNVYTTTHFFTFSPLKDNSDF
jgi:hypothetical protein